MPSRRASERQKLKLRRNVVDMLGMESEFGGLKGQCSESKGEPYDPQASTGALRCQQIGAKMPSQSGQPRLQGARLKDVLLPRARKGHRPRRMSQ